jgi:hypothetical protein
MSEFFVVCWKLYVTAQMARSGAADEYVMGKREVIRWS